MASGRAAEALSADQIPQFEAEAHTLGEAQIQSAADVEHAMPCGIESKNRVSAVRDANGRISKISTSAGERSVDRDSGLDGYHESQTGRKSKDAVVHYAGQAAAG